MPGQLASGVSRGRAVVCPMKPMLDWMPAASLLAEVVGRPVFVVDRHGRVCLSNAQMAKLLGWTRAELAGRPLGDFIDDDALHGDQLARAVDAGRRRWSLTLRARGGEARDAVMTAWRLEDDPTGIVCVVESASSETAPPVVPRWLEVVLAGQEAGTIVGGDDALAGEPCFRAVLGEARACAHCPVLGEALEGRDTTTGAVVAANGRIVVVLGRRTGDGRAEVQHRWLDAGTAGRLVEGQVDALSVRHQLSDREQQVLHALLRGASIQDIAAQLHISPRTVKFHQGNVLGKLGLRSRLELPLLLLDAEPREAGDGAGD